MGNVFVKASFRAGHAVRAYSRRGSSLQALKVIRKELGSKSIKTSYYKRKLNNRAKSILAELKRKVNKGHRVSAYK